MSLTETTILSQAPGPKLWLMSTLSGSGGVHSVRLYWMFIRPTSMGAICTRAQLLLQMMLPSPPFMLALQKAGILSASFSSSVARQQACWTSQCLRMCDAGLLP